MNCSNCLFRRSSQSTRGCFRDSHEDQSCQPKATRRTLDGSGTGTLNTEGEKAVSLPTDMVDCIRATSLPILKLNVRCRTVPSGLPTGSNGLKFTLAKTKSNLSRIQRNRRKLREKCRLEGEVQGVQSFAGRGGDGCGEILSSADGKHASKIQRTRSTVDERRSDENILIRGNDNFRAKPKREVKRTCQRVGREAYEEHKKDRKAVITR
jgi:hypothetical protein